jgi:hypothetical protein
MTWAFKRQVLYATIIIGFFLAILLYFLWPYITKPPTCNDGKQNGIETGVDCGGSCARACIFEVDQLRVYWARSFKVTDGRYNAIAYIENQNKDTAIYKVKYRFRFADKENIYIGERRGETYVPPTGKFAVFEPALNIGNGIPVYTTFEFLEQPTWVKVPREQMDQLKVFVSDINLYDENTAPRLTARITNSSLYLIPEVSVVAILYDQIGNVVNVSNTFIDLLNREQKVDINFTWPDPFTAPIIVKEIIPMYNVFLTKLK